MQKLRKEINAIREKLINYSLLSLIVLTLPAVVFSLIQIYRDGFRLGFSLNFIEFFVVLAIFIFRSKFSISIKAHISASLFIIGG
ncbi:MAG: hypothetical protein M0O93_06850, partial [Bacteroidales bacterium]|nr:hypothetical protein [Bacteroidales bacterium]